MSKRRFEKFYNKHIDKVYRFVFFRVGQNKELTEDLVSEIFLKALDKFATYDENKSISAWIMTISKNHLANYWRSKKENVSLDEQQESEQHTQDKTIFGRAMKIFNKEQKIAEVYEIIENLGEEEKEIVTLHYICGYKYIEIAEMRGEKLSAVKVRAHRAIKKLQKI